MRDAVKNDRARVQIGKISQFGLLEMSRQRLRAGVLAGSTVTCPHCGGAGIVRSVESTTLRLLRALEEEGEKNRAAAVTVKVASDIALYALNQKRRELARIEAEYGMEISFEPMEGLQAGNFELERTRSKEPGAQPRSNSVGIEAGFVPSDEPEDDLPPEEEEDEEIEHEISADGEEVAPVGESESEARAREERGGKRRRRRGGRGRGRDRERGPRPEGADTGTAAPIAAQAEALPGEHPAGEAPQSNGHHEPHEGAEGETLGEGGEPRRRRRRRRGRRGGRERQPGDAPHAEGGHGEGHVALAPELARFGNVPDEIDTTPRADAPAGAPSAPVWSLKDDVPDTTPKDDPSKPVKKGWWQRTFSNE
jgi:ribonuclease E